MNRPKPILFISHSAERTGAPLWLLQFLKWSTKTEKIIPMVLLPSGGVLKEEFDGVAKVVLMPRKPQVPLDARITDLLRFMVKKLLFPFQEWRFRNELARFEPELIFSNTIATGAMLELVSFLKVPVLLHVLEMKYAQNIWGAINMQQVHKYANHMVAINEVVKNDLIENGFRDDEISVIELPLIFKSESNTDKKQRDLSELVVGASGTIEWRKGADLFVLLAQRLVALHPGKKIKFYWLGKPVDDSYFQQLNYDIQKAGLLDLVEFLPTTPDPLSVYKKFNVFVLTAREEPFGLAAAECAAMGIPVIMFDKAGGFISFVKNGAALAVPFMDIDAMADKIFKVLSDDELLCTLRLNANNYIQKNHDGNKNYASMFELIERISKSVTNRS